MEKKYCECNCKEDRSFEEKFDIFYGFVFLFIAIVNIVIYILSMLNYKI